ncbi:MAG: thioredoxin [archaeon]
MPEVLDPKKFDSFIKEKTPCVIDFWASWCGPCQMLGPVFEEMDKEFKGKLRFGKLNVDENQEIAARFEVMSIPCMIVFKNGKESGRIMGFMPKPALKERIQELL